MEAVEKDGAWTTKEVLNGKPHKKKKAHDLMAKIAEDAWVWDLIEIAPVPAVACKLTRGRIERVLKRHRVRRLTSEEVMAGGCFDFCVSDRFSTIERNEWRLIKN